MTVRYLAAIPAAAVGAFLAFLGFLLARRVLRRTPARYPLVSPVRQVLSIGYLAALFLLGERTSLDLYALIIGGALGVTVPSAFFTVQLLKETNQTKSGKEE